MLLLVKEVMLPLVKLNVCAFIVLPIFKLFLIDAPPAIVKAPPDVILKESFVQFINKALIEKKCKIVFSPSPRPS